MGIGDEGTTESIEEVTLDEGQDVTQNDENLDGILETEATSTEEHLHETVEQTINRVKAEAAQKSPNGDKPSVGSEGKKLDKQVNGQSKEAKQPAGQESQEQIEAPKRFSQEAKEAWAAAPKVLKEEYQRAVRDLEAGQQSKLREIHNVKAQAETIVNSIQPWVKDWAASGISAPQGVALLAKTHERMLADPEKECARLIMDNKCDFAKVQAHLNAFQQGTELPSGAANTGGNGYQIDIAQHPQFQALQKKIEQYDNEIRQQTVRAETDKIRALRDIVNADGTKPYGEILNPEFLQYAHPLVSALRTPPRGEDGRFIGGPPMTLVDAYKRAYHAWLSENGNAAQTSATSTQLQNSQQVRKPAQPVSMRPRSVPVGASVVSQNEDQSRFLHETVEQTMARVLREQQQGV